MADWSPARRLSRSAKTDFCTTPDFAVPSKRLSQLGLTPPVTAQSLRRSHMLSQGSRVGLSGKPRFPPNSSFETTPLCGAA